MLAARLRRSAAAVHCSLARRRRLFTSASASPASSAPFAAQSGVFSPSVLRGRVALVSGGTGAIGFAIARLLAQHGARTAVLSRNLRRATDAAADISALCSASSQPGSPACVGYQCDVTDSQQVDATVEHASRDLGGISILVNAHGTSHDALLPRLTDRAILDTLHTNLASCLYLVRAVSRSLLADRAARGGSIVSVGSIVAARGNVGQAAYAASKAGLEGLTRTASRELARYHVNVNLIAPGWIQGDAAAAAHGRPGMMGAAGDEAARRWARRLDERDWAGRPGRVDEVANVALFLCTPAASYIHGAVLHVDGGLRL